MTFVSYAQNFEDVMLWRALRGVEEGRYIDVGAADPRIHSVTAAFYARGWRGLNIEPSAEYHQRLREQRPLDVNLPIALGEAAGEALFHRIPGTGLSTCDRSVADRHREAGWQVVEEKVPVRTLAEVCREHMRGPVHFLKIDVEGTERAVLSGADFVEFRPWIVLVEATEPLRTKASDAGWAGLLEAHAYRPVYFDGLNRFYVAEERLSALSDAFSAPPNVFDDFVKAGDEPSRLMLEAQERAAAAAERAGQAEQRAAAAQATAAAAQAAAAAAQEAAAAAQEAAAAAQGAAAAAQGAAAAAGERARHEAERRQAAEAEARAASRNAAQAEAARKAAVEMLEASRAEARALAGRAAAAEAETRAQAERAAAAAADAASKAEAHARLQAEHAAAVAHMAAVRTSTSWEITGPLRVVGLLARRGARWQRERRAAAASLVAAPAIGQAAPTPVAAPLPAVAAPGPERADAQAGRAAGTSSALGSRGQAILDRLRGAVSHR
jgi:FkbM family methyltransferase